MRPFGEDVAWPFLLLLLLGFVCVTGALAIESHRDLGMGLMAERNGAAHANTLLATDFGLTLRLQLPAFLGWLAGAIVAGAFFGGVAQAMTGAINPSNAWAKAFVGGGDDVLAGILSIFALFDGLLAAAFAIQCMVAARSQEANGPLELQLSRGLSRMHWLLNYVTIAAVGAALMLVVSGLLMGATSQGGGNAWDLMWNTFAYWPAVVLMIGLCVFLFGFMPRHCASVAWAIYGLSLAVAMFGGLFSLSQQAIKRTPFGAVPRMPLESFSAGPLVILTLIAVIVGAVGLWKFKQRDIETD